MTLQLDLLTAQPAAVRCDPAAPAADRPRLSRQCRVILDWLRQGPLTNQELSQIALKYTSRISELRAAGYNVQCIEHDHATGRAVYELQS